MPGGIGRDRGAVNEHVGRPRTDDTFALGAKVLDDVSFSEMPLEKMTKVLQPEVDGAI